MRTWNEQGHSLASVAQSANTSTREVVGGWCSSRDHSEVMRSRAAKGEPAAMIRQRVSGLEGGGGVSDASLARAGSVQWPAGGPLCTP